MVLASLNLPLVHLGNCQQKYSKFNQRKYYYPDTNKSFAVDDHLCTNFVHRVNLFMICDVSKKLVSWDLGTIGPLVANRWNFRLQNYSLSDCVEKCLKMQYKQSNVAFRHYQNSV